VGETLRTRGVTSIPGRRSSISEVSTRGNKGSITRGIILKGRKTETVMTSICFGSLSANFFLFINIKSTRAKHRAAAYPMF
jgi:hypothetical protein